MAVMAERRAETVWNGDLAKGSGTITKTGSGAFGQLPVTWAARTESSDGKTSPEELIAMAHASCYSMAFAHALAGEGSPPERLHVTAVCTLDRTEAGPKINRMDLEVRGKVPGIDQARFDEIARKAEQGCPVSNVLRNNAEIHLKATLE